MFAPFMLPARREFGEATDEKDGQGWVQRACFGGELDAAHPRHHLVGDEQVEMAAAIEQSQRLGPAGGGEDEVAEFLQAVDENDDVHRVYAAVIVAMQIGMFLLRDQIGRTIGADLETPAGHLRMLRAAVEIFSQPLLTPEQTAQAQTALERLLTEKESS